MLFSWIGLSCVLFFLGAHLYSRVAHDAWGESNIDSRVFFGGFLAGCGFCWFLLGPSFIFGSIP